MKDTLKIGQEVLIHGYVDEIRKDTVIVRNEGGYFGTVEDEVTDIEMPDTNKVLDKIRAEILEEKECAYADFERYKVEYLGQDSEDVLDSLPQDDFRYGMERCIDIIDKYKAESENP